MTADKRTLDYRPSLISDLQSLSECTATSFADLAAAANLDPAVDFIGADLRGADLRNQDLRAFNFSGADFAGAKTEGAKFNKESLATANNFGQDKNELLREGTTWFEPISGNVPNDPPVQALTLINTARTGNMFAQLQALKALAAEYADYQERGIFSRIIPRIRRKSVTPPVWFRELLIEKIATSGGWTSIVSLCERIFADAFGGAIDKAEILKKKIIHSNISTEKIDAILDFANEYGSDLSAQEFLLNAAQTESDQRIKKALIAQLRFIDNDWDELRSWLLEVFYSSEDAPIRGEAIRALSALRVIDGEIQAMIVNCAFDVDTHHERMAALVALADFWGDDEATNNVIVGALLKSALGNSSGAKHTAIELLAEIIKDSKNLDEIITAIFDHQQHGVDRYYAFMIMYRHFPESKVVNRIVGDFERLDPNKDYLMIKYIIDIACNRPDVLKKIRPSLFEIAGSCWSMNVSSRALAALASDFETDEHVKRLVIDLVQNGQISEVRASAIAILASNIDRVESGMQILRDAYARFPEDFVMVSHARKLLEEA